MKHNSTVQLPHYVKKLKGEKKLKQIEMLKVVDGLYRMKPKGWQEEVNRIQDEMGKLFGLGE